MYRVDTNRLCGKIVEKGYNQQTFADAVGVCRETMRGYLKDYNRIPYKVLSKMVEVLDCGYSEAKEIFFAC